MHATIAHLEVDEMVMKLNMRNKKFEELLTMSLPDVRWLTGPNGKERWNQLGIKQEAKRQKKAEAAAQKEQAEVDKQRRWQDIMLGQKEVVFSGGLSSKKVHELHDTAFALGIEDEGNKDMIITLIKAKLSTQPKLQENPRFDLQDSILPIDKNSCPSIQPPAACHRLDIPLLVNIHPSSTAGLSQQMSHNFGLSQPMPRPSHTFSPYHLPQYISYKNPYNTDDTQAHATNSLPVHHPPPLIAVHNHPISPTSFYYSNTPSTYNNTSSA
jgi:hypothetical protein